MSEQKLDRRLGWGLFASAFVWLLLTERAAGFTRDESVYFAAAESYARWVPLLWRAPAQAFADGPIVQAWDLNHEHPALLKLLFGLSWLVFHEGLGWLRAAAAFRLPAFAFAALVLPLTYALARRFVGRPAAVFAAVSFLLVPRQFFEAHLACFDVPITALWLLVVYCFARSREGGRWWLWTGLAFGAALASKHNALFLPFVLAPFGLHQAWKETREAPEAKETALWLVLVFVLGAGLFLLQALALGTERFQQTFDVLSPQAGLYAAMICGGGALLWRLRRQSAGGFAALAPLWAMALGGPALFYLTWPYLWHHPVDRTAWYLAFHATHVHYTWFYLGELLREPPFPLDYVVVKTALTVPTALFVPMLLGLAWVGVRAVRRQAGWLDALVVANALASIAIISHPSVPHFGGVKHWFPSMPFLAVLAATSVERAAGAASEWLRQARKQAWAQPGAVTIALAALLCASAAIANQRVYPWGTSHYSELAGGLPGAASMGMQRQFWSNNVTGVLEWLNQSAPPGSRVYLHEVNGYSIRDYQREGMLRKDLAFVGDMWSADFVAYQYHQEFRDYEFSTWQALGTTKPAFGLYVDETPQIVVYRRVGR